jgi:hypothetical protein
MLPSINMRIVTRTSLFVAPLLVAPALAVLWTLLNHNGKIIAWTGSQELPAKVNLYSLAFCILLLAVTGGCWHAATKGYALPWRLAVLLLFAAVGFLFYQRFMDYNT